MPNRTPTSESSAEPDLTGQHLGEYMLLHRLAQGGMAVLYLAQQESLRRKVAVKVLRKSLASDESYVRRFHQEAQLAASLVQANIVQIYEVGCIDGIHFIAQEYVNGRNLKHLLHQHGRLDVATAIQVMRQVAAALHRAGEHGIIHRDIKPENILLANSGEVKVADFGLARVVGDSQALALTQVGITMGTPLYMSPEQVEGQRVDQRSDIYSFGVTCYQLLAGHPPFDGDTALNVAVQHLKTEPRRLEQLRSDLPISLCCVVHKMMAKAPEDRFQSTAELLKELRKVPVDEVDGARPINSDWGTTELSAISEARLAATQRLETVMSTQAIEPAAGHRRWTWAVGLAPLALIAGGIVAWMNPPEPLLKPDPYQVAIPEQETVQQQYRYAFWANTKDAWRSVEQYFPVAAPDLTNDEKAQRQQYGRRAKQRLAELYLHDGDDESAMEIFTDLANLEATASEFRAFGIAGQAIVYDHRNEPELMARKLDEVYRLRNHLQPSMRARIERLNRERNQGQRRPLKRSAPFETTP